MQFSAISSRLIALPFYLWLSILLNLLLLFLLLDTLLRMQGHSAYVACLLPRYALPFILPSIVSCSKTV